ncbi:hypothetical protein DEI81_07975 [Curtobacterium sp. MCBD17_013]|uniref:hypothetical protein n=1 Tax=Curtobacterium sp. MCBD17_013 TaxID=2175668 RepID=UPI000DA85BA8|nr:hypothetical protein [Curtobacterium sp. MCBD17_013]PZF63335.1 hypothetical protein DEI81_07975 [Curtobacterium sp. MCBD17_013]
MDIINFPTPHAVDDGPIERANVGMVEVTTGWVGDDGKPETREATVVLLVTNDEYTLELNHHMTVAEAHSLAEEIVAATTRIRLEGMC